MKLFFRIAIALILGIVIGSAINMLLIITGSYIIKFPDNIEVNSVHMATMRHHLFKGRLIIYDREEMVPSKLGSLPTLF